MTFWACQILRMLHGLSIRFTYFKNNCNALLNTLILSGEYSILYFVNPLYATSMKISASILIQAPIERVFSVFSDLGKLEERVTDIQKIEVLQEPAQMAKSS